MKLELKDKSVALFVPCYVDQLYPGAGVASAKLLEKLGVKYEFPTKQTCCGQPAFNSGYWDEAKSVARHFAGVFERYDLVVTPSGSCAAMCRKFYREIDEDAAEVGGRVYELCEFLVKFLGIESVEARLHGVAALHVGCHTRREIGAADYSKTLLESVMGLELKEIEDVEKCCGFGGTFSVKMPELSVSMGKEKVKNIIDTGADFLVSPDMSCLMHIEGLLRKYGSKIKVMHVAEVLARGVR